jgi:hypothetical protein
VGAAGAADKALFPQADDELLEIGARQSFVVGHLGQADRAAAVMAGQLDHEPRPVFAAGREMDRAGTGEDAPRTLERLTRYGDRLRFLSEC